ncbi:hypothetical protein WMY93_019011 [Mugilogobius chulae]|uniref:Uncharacterized protein n=1 Tax=Mugilogobius chulae TaxID=88201 RepID=A0AAW0NFZ8_9GOBI
MSLQKETVVVWGNFFDKNNNRPRAAVWIRTLSLSRSGSVSRGSAHTHPDEGTPDEGTPDEGTPDEGTPDEGTPDEGTPDEERLTRKPDEEA